MHKFLQVVPLGRLGRAACKLAHVRMVVSAHHLGVCVLADGQGLIAHKLRVSSSSLTASHKLPINQSINAHEGFISHVGGRPNTTGVPRK